MLTELYDMQIKGKKLGFRTRLPKSFIGVLVSSLNKDGVEVLDIRDCGMSVVVTTSLCAVEMTGSWSVNAFKTKLRNEYYRFLNERFDQRVEMLKNKGYQYYKEYTCFAKSEMSARNHNGIPNSAIMHENDFLFNFRLDI